MLILIKGVLSEHTYRFASTHIEEHMQQVCVFILNFGDKFNLI